ncbi:MAG: pyrimidine-nucleoside phosphorylase [Actinomycetota bacterium]|nr:pyrimidine-nucleoside phosphorylase [Actinomycetota bacterium]
MRACDIIARKGDGLRLNAEEIDFMVQGFVEGDIPDYQMSAFLMAAYIRGLNEEETIDLTKSMIASGRCVDLSSVKGIKVDKHSTGGVGDTTTLVLAPLVAAAGVPVAKMSGRALGHTGGTLDKLESIPGFNVNLSEGQFIKQVNRIGVAIAGATADIVPADKKIYALRDVTATVSSIPLIASSVMSKKIAGGADAIVLDVKTGSGAFMETLSESRKLAKILVTIGHKMGRKTVAIMSDMNQPLGFAVGNALEVKEAINTLKGKGPSDLTELCFTLGSYMLVLAGIVSKPEEGRALLKDTLSTGKALDKFGQLIETQGGDPKVLSDQTILPQAELVEDYLTGKEGYILCMDAKKIGEAVMELGAGRETKESAVDLSVGLILCHKVGDRVELGEPIVKIHANNYSKLQKAISILKEAIIISDERPQPRPLVCDIITENKKGR